MSQDQDGIWTDYVWLNGKLVGMIRNGNVHSVHTDQTGRPEGMTNSQRTIVWRARNYAFDREVTAGQASGFNLGFPGQYSDPEVGDYWYNGYRDYSALLGRYLESDPIGLAGGINTYVYANSDPISVVDPSGLDGVGPWTFAPGSADAADYQRATNGCYDQDAELFAAITITQAILGGPEDPAADVATAEEIALVEGESVSWAVTTGARTGITNITTSATADEAGAALESNGFTSAVSADGRATIYTNTEGDMYVIRPSNSAPGGQAMDYTPGNGGAPVKINLGSGH